jgi:ankyrin repeat protein
MKLVNPFRKASGKMSQADIDALGEELHAAADRGDLDAVKKLHAQGADIDYSAVNFGTALVAAAGEGHPDIVDYLLENKADVTLCNMHRQTPLHMAIRQNEDDAVALKLIMHSTDMDGRDMHGKTPASYAAQNGKARVLEALAAKGADFAIPDNKGMTPLMLATGLSHAEAVDALLKHPCGLDAQDELGCTALIHAVRGRNAKLVKKYLSLGADFDLKDKNGETAAALAKRLPDAREITALLEEAEAARIRPFHSGTENSVTIMKKLVLKGITA